MAYVAVAVSVISMAATAYTTYAQAENAQEMGEYNKKVAENNALAAQQQGAVQASEHRQKVRQMLATQNAAYAASGVDPGTGSAGKVMDDTAGFGELDILRILNNAANSGAGMRQQGELEKWKGDAAFSTGMFKMVGDAAEGGAKTYYGGKKAGAW